MTIDQYWAIIDRVHKASPDDMDKKCDLLKNELSKLPATELRSFVDHFDQVIDRAYAWPLWAAAYIINGGCSDDSFMDFRATLISMGQKTFEAALQNPATLADLDINDGEDFIYEGYQYVSQDLLEEKVPDFRRYAAHPREPSGQPFDEDTVSDLFPTLAEKFS